MLDLQVNGLAAEDFYCDFWQAPDDESINKLCAYQYKHGVDEILATLITAPLEKFRENLQGIKEYKKNFDGQNQHAQILGVHIEGGLISRMGVHPQEHAQVFDVETARKLIDEFGELIKLWTLCPQLDKDGELTKMLQSNGIIVSYGHSNASYSEAMQAFENYGVRLVTHWGNAMYIMKDFKQRNCSDEDLDKLDSLEIDKVAAEDIGIGLAAYRHPEVYCMAIAGSHAAHDLHLDPKLLTKLIEKKQEKLILVSDSVAYNGALPPEHLLGGLQTLGHHYKNVGIPINQVKLSDFI